MNIQQQDFRLHVGVTVLLLDAMRVVDMQPGDGEAAIADMLRTGAQPGCLKWIDTA